MATYAPVTKQASVTSAGFTILWTVGVGNTGILRTVMARCASDSTFVLRLGQNPNTLDIIGDNSGAGLTLHAGETWRYNLFISLNAGDLLEAKSKTGATTVFVTLDGYEVTP